MKKKLFGATSLAVLALTPGAFAVDTPSNEIPGQVLLAGWHDFNNNSLLNEGADYVIGGVAQVVKSDQSHNTGNSPPNGSTDGIYGPSGWGGGLLGAITTGQPNLVDGHLNLSQGTTRFEYQNTTPFNIQLLTMLFDSAYHGQPAGNDLSSSFSVGWQISAPAGSGGLTTSIVTLVNGETQGGQDFGDRRFQLTPVVVDKDGVPTGGNPVPTLFPGETISFLFTALSGTTLLDNVGLVGTQPIPEPGSLFAIGCFLGSGLLIRRKRR
jgi:hypothetical protein